MPCIKRIWLDVARQTRDKQENRTCFLSDITWLSKRDFIDEEIKTMSTILYDLGSYVENVIFLTNFLKQFFSSVRKTACYVDA
jgi:hypothetical protein